MRPINSVAILGSFLLAHHAMGKVLYTACQTSLQAGA